MKHRDETPTVQGGLPANPRSTSDAYRVLKYLAELPDRTDRRLLPGQNLWHYPGGIAGGQEAFAAALAEATGKWPPLVELPYADPTEAPDVIAAANRVAIDYWQAGGLVSIFINPCNPWTGGKSTDLTNRENNIPALLTPGTPENLVWIEKLDALAAGLTQLRDAGVVVLWRPLHEMTFIECYWYDCGAYSDPEVFKNLWRHMFCYFTYEKGLDNLLWVYAAANVGGWGGPPADSVYPGDDYVDIVGIDVYSNDFKCSGDAYARLTALGKPFALTEVGPAHGKKAEADGSWDNMGLLNIIRTEYPRTVYALYWHSWPGAKMALVDNQNADKLMNDSWAISRSEVDWRSTVVADLEERQNRQVAHEVFASPEPTDKRNDK